MELLRDPIWQFVGAAIGVFAILLAIRQSKSKKITYEVTYTNVIVREDNALYITYNGKRLSHPQIIEIKFENSGNTPLPKTDYERPIEVILTGISEILSLDVTQRFPENLAVVVNKKKNVISISPELMNRGDSFSVRAFLNQSKNREVSIQINSRIIGVKKIEKPLSEKAIFHTPKMFEDVLDTFTYSVLFRVT